MYSLYSLWRLLKNQLREYSAYEWIKRMHSETWVCGDSLDKSL